MMKMHTALKMLAVALLSGCSGPPAPVIDLRASGEAATHAQRDQMECEWLLEKNDLDEAALVDCLEGRGHNVLQE
jgi:hypothetical protein